MQAIQESNEHLAKAIEYIQREDNIDKELFASFETQFAEIKATQAMAHAIVYLGDMVHNASIRLK